MTPRSKDSVGAVALDLVIDGKSYNAQIKNITRSSQKQLKGMESQFTGSFGRIAKMAAGAFAAVGIGKFVGDCLSLGSALTEVENITAVAFPGMTKQVNDFAKNAASQFGLSETMAKRFTGMYGTMAKQFGYTNEAAFEMGSTLAGLAGDVASFYDMSQDEAYTKLKAVFSGETEVLKDIGIVMTQAALDQYALANSYGKTTAKMNEQEKVALRYAFVQEQLTAASGDFIRTQDSWANQTRLLSLQFDSLKASLGKGFIALFTPIIKGINWVLSNLQVLADSFASMMEFLTGTSSSGSGGGALADTSNDIASATDSADGLSSGLGDAGKAGEKAAKKINKAFAKVDTINKLTFDDSSDDSSESGSGSGSIGGTSGKVDFSEISKGESIISDSMKKLLDILAKFGTISFEPIIKAFGDFTSALKPIGTTLFDGLLWALDNVLYPLSKWTIEDFLPAFLGVLEGALTVLNPILKAFGEIFKVVWDIALKPIAQWTGGVIVSVLTGIGDALKDIGNWMSNNQGTVTTITGAILGFFGAWKVVELLSFIQQSGGVIACLKGITTAIAAGTIAKIKDKAATMTWNLMYAKDFVKNIASSTIAFVKSTVQITIDTAAKIANKIATMAHTVAQVAMNIATGAWNIICGIATAVTTAFSAAIAFLTSPIGLVIVAITAIIGIITLLIKNWETVKEVTLRVWDNIKECIDTTVKTIQNIIETVFNAIKSVIEFVFDAICTTISYYVNLWKSIITTILQAIKNIWETVWGSISSFFSGIWDGICSGVNTAINLLSTTISNVLDTIKRTWETMWNGLKNFVKTTWDTIIGFFSAGGKVFDGVVGAIGDIFKTICNAIIGGINKVIAAPLKVISDSLKTIHDIDLPLIGKPFTIVPRGFNIPQIPKLAQGGYVKANQPQLAMIGDNRHQGEVVAPEGKMVEMINTALRMQKDNGSVNGIDEVIKLLRLLIETINGLCLKVDIDMKKLSILLEKAKRERDMIGG